MSDADKEERIKIVLAAVKTMNNLNILVDLGCFNHEEMVKVIDFMGALKSVAERLPKNETKVRIDPTLN